MTVSNLSAGSSDNRPLRAVRYLRVSTEEQVDGTSLATQDVDTAAWVAANGMVDGGVYCDAGWSGTRLDRPDLQRMLADFDRDLFDVVVVYNRTRLARNPVVIAEFARRGIRILSATETNSDGSASGELSQDVIDAVAAFQARRIGETVRRAVRDRAEHGYFHGGRVPRGFDVVDAVLVPNDEMVYVERMFRERDAGASKKQISEGLMRDGYMIDNTGIRKTLANRVYLGEIHFRGGWFPGRHAAVIEREVFDRVQGRERGDLPSPASSPGRRSYRYDFLLPRGMLRCSCGAGMAGRVWRNGNGVPNIARYVCSKRVRFGASACPTPPLDAGRVDAAVIAYFDQQIHDRDGTIARIRVSRDVRATERAQIVADAERDVATATARVEQCERDYGVITGERWNALHDRLTGELDAAVARRDLIRDNRADRDDDDLADRIASIDLTADRPAVRDALRGVFDAFRVGDDGLVYADVRPSSVAYWRDQCVTGADVEPVFKRVPMASGGTDRDTFAELTFGPIDWAELDEVTV